MSAMKKQPEKQPETECGCPRFEKARKWINHTLACLIARRGERSIDDYYRK